MRHSSEDARTMVANICSRLIEIGIAFLVISTPVYYGSTHLEATTMIELIIILMILLWGIEMAIRGDFVFRRTPLDIIILLFCAYSIVSTILFSRYAHASREALSLLLCFSALYFMVVNHIRSRKQLLRLLVIILLVGFVQAFSHLMQNAAGLLHASTGDMLNVGNHFAGYMVIIIPLAVAMSFVVRDVGKRVLLMFASVVMAAAMAFSLVTGAILAFLLSLAFIALLFAGAESVRKRTLVPGVIALCLIFMVLWFGHDSIFDELISVTNLKTGSPATRLSLWKSSLAIFADHPMAGIGLGVFDYIYPQYRLPDMYGRAVYAHSDWLQLLTELGIIGFVMALLGSVLFFLSVMRKSHAEVLKDRLTRGLVVGGLSSIGAGAAHALVDFNLHIPAIATLFTIIIALTVAASLSSTAVKKKSSIQIRIPAPVRVASPICLFIVLGFFAVLLLRPCIANAHYRDGAKLEADLQWDRAAEKYQSAFNLSRGDSRRIYALGNVYAKRVAMTRGMETQKKWFGLASDAYKQAIKLRPTNGDYYLVLGNLYETVENMEDAEIAYKKAISLDPNNAFYHMTYGDFCLKLGNTQRALAEYRKTLEVNPDDLHNILNTGYQTLGDGWKDLVSEICPHNVNSCVTLAQFCADREWYDVARSEYEQAISIWPDRTDLRKRLSHLLVKQGMFDESASLWRQFLESHPQNAQAYAQLAGIYVQQKRTDEAIQQFLAAADVEPGNSDYLVRAADLYMRQGRSAESIELWQTAIRRNPHTASSAYHALGKYHDAQGNWMDALSYLQQAIGADPRNLGYRLHLAGRYHERELLYEAVQEWERALKLQPENISVHLQIARIYRKINRLDKAREHYRRVLKLQPGNIEAKGGISESEDSV